jgi:hypothetical protein
MSDDLLGDSEHWTELAELHHQRTHLLLGHYEERIKRAELEVGLRSIDRKAASLADRSNRLPCLLRGTVGADHTKYHAEDAPCGRVTGKGRDISSFMRLPEGRVFYAVHRYEYDLGLERCSSCQWHQAAMIHGRRLLDAKLRTN